VEFPYPSGEGLHVGHPRPYTAMDVLARFKRMQGYNVLYPIGFDSFGLPTENYAIKTGIHPAEVTKTNIATFTQQLKALGLSFDWSRVVSTSDPEYYKWTQWIFLKLYENGMAYKDKMPINWCLSCKIGLANEEVVNGKCERCGGEVEQREKEQWMLRITKYADRLIDDLELVDYPKRVSTSQINWIGKSTGALIDFDITFTKEPKHNDYKNSDGKSAHVSVFTTRPDTIFGVTYLVLSPEHPWVRAIWDTNFDDVVENKDEVAKYVAEAVKKTEIERSAEGKEKTGIELKGIKAINPLTKKEVPIFVADYVLAKYGTGAIMAVPAHDQRDYEFAKKFDLPIIQVVDGGDISKQAHIETENNKLVNSAQFDGMTVDQASVAIMALLKKEKLGEESMQYKLRDWVFSRQRYWGEPIPMIYCENCKNTGAVENGWVPVPVKDLPVTLPNVEKYEPTDDGQSPLASINDWVNVECPTCGAQAKRETDTMPNWAGSNWYFLRYTDSDNHKSLASEEALSYWMAVDWYNGGMEHTTLHLLYSRFIYKFLYDIGAVPRECGVEPYLKRTSHGLILGEGGEKMSKSKGNVVNPNEIVEKFGADTLRVYEMFMGPFEQAIPWDEQGVVGVRRFLDRVNSIYTGKNVVLDKKASDDLIQLTHQTIKKVTADIETQGYNTAISALMILANAIIEQKKMDQFVAQQFLKLLSPFAPHLAEELWQVIGGKKTIALESWPVYDEAKLQSQEVEIAIQINGKFRGKLKTDINLTQQKVEALAKNQPNVMKYLEGKDIKNVIFVPNRLINFVC